MSKYAGKKEAQAALTAARLKAQAAHEAIGTARSTAETDALTLHYQRCVREFEEAINDYDEYDTGDD
jgi:hypothetical protein